MAGITLRLFVFQVPASYVNSLARSRPVTSTALPVTFPHTHTHTHSTPCLVLNRPPAPLYPMESRSYNLNTMCVCESICILEPVFAFNLGFEQAHTRPPKAPFLSVATQIFREIAQFRTHGRLPRPEGPRQSLRSGSRSDSFWGSGPGGCTEMHYSPRIWQKRGPELALLFPLPLLPSPSSSLPPLTARGPGSQGGRRVRRDHGPQSATSLLCF